METEGYSAVPATEQPAENNAPVGIEMTSNSGPTSERLSIVKSPKPSETVSTKAEPVPTPYQRYLAKARALVEAFAEHPAFIGLMSLFTIWALYNDDIRLAASGKDADSAYEIVISIGFFLFIFEIFASSFYKADYINLPDLKRGEDESTWEYYFRICQFGSFYFWLDWIATLSLILEVSLFYLINYGSDNCCRFNGSWALLSTQ